MRFISKHLGASAGSFSGLKFHINVANFPTITKDGSNRISQINDMSGQSNNANQTTELNKTIYTVNGINGKPAAFFDGSNDYFDLDTVLPNSGDFTLYFVFQPTAEITDVSVNQSVVAPVASILPRGGVLFGASSFPNATFYGVGLDGTADQGWSYTTGTITAVPHVFKMKLTGDTTTVSIDGVDKVVTEGLGGMDSTHSLKNVKRIGLGLALTNPLNGLIGEIVYYDESLSDAHDTLETNLLIDYWL